MNKQEKMKNIDDLMSELRSMIEDIISVDGYPDEVNLALINESSVNLLKHAISVYEEFES